MVINIIYFIGGVLVIHAAEQYAYQRFTTSNKQGSDPAGAISQGYGWRIIWDAAYFFVLLGAGQRIIFSSPSLAGLEWLGYAAFLLGVMLRVWSLNALGYFYDAGIAIKPDHQLIGTGPYLFLRHPLHLGTLLKITGLALFSSPWLAVPAVLASLLLALNLNRSEDRTHLDQFASSFKEYHRSTWDIVDLFFWKNRPE